MSGDCLRLTMWGNGRKEEIAKVHFIARPRCEEPIPAEWSPRQNKDSMGDNRSFPTELNLWYMWSRTSPRPKLQMQRSYHVPPSEFIFTQIRSTVSGNSPCRKGSHTVSICSREHVGQARGDGRGYTERIGANNRERERE